MPNDRGVNRPVHGNMQTIRLVVFPGGFNWPLWVAQSYGFFAQEGIAVEVTPTPGSVFQLTGLIEGRFDMAITLVDNVIAYREGQGEVPLAGPDLFAFMAADTRVYPALVTLPEIKHYADLRGKTLSVDALRTGYALVLVAMLEHGGLKPGDYRLESFGGAQERFVAMGERLHAGCLLNSPFERLLQVRGFNILDTAIAVLGKYQGQVAASNKAWAMAHREAVVSFCRAFLKGVDWLYEPCNRELAFDIFVSNSPGSARATAETAWSVLCDAQTGLPRDGAIDTEALTRVIELRGRYGIPAKRLGAPGVYYDGSYLEAARWSELNG